MAIFNISVSNFFYLKPVYHIISFHNDGSFKILQFPKGCTIYHISHWPIGTETNTLIEKGLTEIEKDGKLTEVMPLVNIKVQSSFTSIFEIHLHQTSEAFLGEPKSALQSIYFFPPLNLLSCSRPKHRMVFAHNYLSLWNALLSPYLIIYSSLKFAFAIKIISGFEHLFLQILH